ncbi:MAG: hypothetical protein IJ733_07100 [Lachnospiraceae bacterium]|nr:hypothetical protein [Lachnospiraceae bacterium]
MFWKKENHLPYEVMMEELFYADIGDQVLDQVSGSEHWGDNSHLPLRYRLIGQAFVEQEGLDELNEELMEHDCRPLYARNSLECTLIYAFANRLSYTEWRKVFRVCENIRDGWGDYEKERNRFFQNNQITFGELEAYVLDYSDYSENGLKTRSITWVLNDRLQEMASDYGQFFRFYASVMDEFTDVYEKARYYFCKYLYYHLMEKIAFYMRQVGTRMPTQEELAGLLPIKAESVLRRRVTPSDEIMEVLRGCPLSPGTLFEQFNAHFFGYVSMDWVELMLEDIVDVRELSEKEIHKLSDHLRALMSKKQRKECEEKEDAVIVQAKIRELQQKEGVKGSRKGETTIRKYLRGELDLDRTTLICFLLYFSSSVISRSEIRISIDRINEILDECGFSMLRKKNAFDRFVLKYIESDDPADLLMLEMDQYIRVGKNFYLYEMYTGSTSNAQEIRKLKEKNLI